MARFEGQTVFITGAGSGIGLEMARQFHAEGAQVYSADLNPNGCADGTIPVKLDVTDEDAFAGAINGAILESGGISVLCNNAGASSTSDPVECSSDEWDYTFAVNARAVFIGTKYVLPSMLRNGKGSIVNTASAAGLIGLPDRAAYCASKGAVIAFTKQVAVQYASRGVRCNCVCPGTVDSPWVSRLLAADPDPDQAYANLVARQPMGRLGTPEEVARAAVYLASDDAAFMTGTALMIDGGLTAL